MLVCIGLKDVVPVAPKGGCEFALAGGPPAFRTANNHDGMWFQGAPDGFGEISAKVYVNAGLYVLPAGELAELFFCKPNCNVRRFERQGIWDHLRNVDGDAGAESARQGSGRV